MGNWKYTLCVEGKILRNLINKEETIENIVEIYSQMIKCLETWKSRLAKTDKQEWEYDIELMIEDLKMSIPDVEDNSLDYEAEKENLNYNLKDFYDMCDYGKVWIGV